MKLTPLILILSLFCTSAFAQNDAEALKTEIKSLHKQLLIEKEKTTYLKAALELRKGNVEIELDSVVVKIVEIKGNRTDNKITIKGLITYLGTTKRNLQFAAQQIVDPKGNTLQSFTAATPNNLENTFRIQQAETKIPYAFIVQFKEADERMPIISLLRLQIYSKRIGSVSNYNFKGLDVHWN